MSILSLFYIAIGIKVVRDLVRNWKAVWDTHFTMQDRAMVDQAAFFLLIPISVVLHECGHAIAITAFGRRVLDFGFYIFAGWVSYNPIGMTAVQTTIIAAAGTIVNIILCLLGLALVLWVRPKLRPAYNELALQFVFLSGINALIFYPVLDLLSGMNGDWRQMYGGGVAWLTAIIVLVQVGMIALGYYLVTNDRWSARLSALAGVPAGYRRGMLGGVRPVAPPTMSMRSATTPLDDAVERVRSGWGTPVLAQAQMSALGYVHVLQWRSSLGQHVVVLRRLPGEDVEILTVPSGGGPPRLLRRIDGPPGADDLTLALRLAMESVDPSGGA